MYLYLARRNKKGIKVLAILTGIPLETRRVTIADIYSFGIPQQYMDEFKKVFHENRIKFEPWIEQAENYAELLSRLRKRGFTNLSLDGSPLFDDIFDTSFFGDEIQIETTGIKKIKRTMLRKNNS